MIGRNDPCWCGSNNKYKKCHLQKDLHKQKLHKRSTPQSPVKTAKEIEGMRRAGAFNGELMDYIRPYVQIGVSTEELNTLVHEYTVSHGHTPACLGYLNYPKSVCISINEVVCHGIPSEQTILKEGDIVNIDLTTIVEGFYGDSSEMFLIGNVSDEAHHVVEVSAQSLLKSIEAIGPGLPLSTVAQVIQPFAESRGCSVVRQFTGHGIGTKFHESFTVCHHIARDCDSFTLQPGMTFTIEPMINNGAYQVFIDPIDKWTVRTKDGSLSAQFEHTVLITENGADVLTRTPSQIATETLLNYPNQV